MTKKQLRKREMIARLDLARRLEMSPSTIGYWVEKGILEAHYHKLGKGKGRRVYFNWADVCQRLGIEE